MPHSDGLGGRRFAAEDTRERLAALDTRVRLAALDTRERLAAEDTRERLAAVDTRESTDLSDDPLSGFASTFVWTSGALSVACRSH